MIHTKMINEIKVNQNLTGETYKTLMESFHHRVISSL